jgi:hypothetical protein
MDKYHVYTGKILAKLSIFPFIKVQLCVPSSREIRYFLFVAWFLILLVVFLWIIERLLVREISFLKGVFSLIFDLQSGLCFKEVLWGDLVLTIWKHNGWFMRPVIWGDLWQSWNLESFPASPYSIEKTVGNPIKIKILSHGPTKRIERTNEKKLTDGQQAPFPYKNPLSTFYSNHSNFSKKSF